MRRLLTEPGGVVFKYSSVDGGISFYKHANVYERETLIALSKFHYRNENLHDVIPVI